MHNSFRFVRILFFSLILILLMIVIKMTENTKKTPKHHLENGTFVNTNGVANNKKLKELWKWMTGKKETKAIPIDFEMVDPNLELINQNKSFSITWIGHASFLYQNKELNILTDPHLTNRASPINFAGPQRYTKPAMKFEELPKIDFVTISHNHYDHLDLKTVKWIAKNNPDAIFLVPLGLKKWFIDKSINNVIELDWWESHIIGDTKITFTPVQHWSSRTLFDRNQTLWGGWHIKNDSHSLIHLGDTGYSDDFKETFNRLGSVDLALIPIGAYAPRWFMKFSHMNPTEAVQAFIDLNAEKAIGMHWGTFILTDEPVDEPPLKLEEELASRSLDGNVFITMIHGQTINLGEN